MVRLAAWLLFTLKGVIAIVLFAIMVLTGIDVIGRYLFSRPVPGANEMIAAGMAILIFGSLPLVALRAEHITIDSVSGLLRGAARKAQVKLVHAIGAGVLGYLAYRLLVLGEKMTRSGEHSSMLHVPYGLLAYLLAAMAAVSALVTFGLLFRKT